MKTQLPLAGARVAARRRGASAAATRSLDAITDAKGNFTIGPLAAGNVRPAADRVPDYSINGAQSVR